MQCKRLMREIVICTVVLFLARTSSAQAAAQNPPWYDIVEITPLGGTISVALALNQAGIVSGWAETADIDPTGCYGTGSLIFRAYRSKGVKTIPIGTFGGNNSQSNAINEQGAAAGFAETATPDPNFPPCLTNHAFLSQGSTLVDLGTVGSGNNSQALGVNNSGQVAGFSENGQFDPNFGFPVIHAFSWKSGTLTDLPTLGGANAAAGGINNSGAMLGFSEVSTVIDPQLGIPDYHAVLWRNGSIVDLKTLGGAISGIGTAGSGLPFFGSLSLNSRGQVAGYSQTSQTASDPVPAFTNFTPVPAGAFNNEVHAFLWNSGAMRDLGTLGGGFSEGSALNQAGHVAGMSTADHVPDGDNEAWFGVDFPKIHAGLWRDGYWIDLGTLGGPVAQSLAINNSDQVVGWSVLNDNSTLDAFLWQNGWMVDLNSAIDPKSDWILIQASQINDQGEIAGFGLHHGEARAFLLKPSSANFASGASAPGWLKPRVKLAPALVQRLEGKAESSRR